ncbi:MAG: divalent-cation tolerance protein CutA [Methylococcaceae bacterium]
MSEKFNLIFCTCPNQKTAEKLAHDLIQKKLAGCINILPGLTSVYPWQGKIETAQEILLLIKSRNDLFPSLQATITELHPYELPEIIAVPIHDALPDYLQWINSWLTLK